MRPPPVEVRRARPEELADCLAVRREVFVLGQGVPEEVEADGHDAACAHVVALVEGRVVGTARLRVVDGKAKAERVAVLPAYRGCGVGAALVGALEAEARARGFQEVHLHAQEPVVAFYERLGYETRSPGFLEAGIPHRAMRRVLEQNP